jgi:hypothetical protein
MMDRLLDFTISSRRDDTNIALDEIGGNAGCNETPEGSVVSRQSFKNQKSAISNQKSKPFPLPFVY